MKSIKYVINRLEFQKKSYLEGAYLAYFMNKYELYDTYRKSLEGHVRITGNNEIPLPSGRWGNVIALALELNCYKSAELLINNAETFQLDTEIIASDFGGKNEWTLEDEFEYSQLTFNETQIKNAIEYIKSLSDSKVEETHIKCLEAQKKSIENIQKIINTKKESKKKTLFKRIFTRKKINYIS